MTLTTLNMQDVKEAVVYATVNGAAAFSLYTGAAILFGDPVKAAIISGVGAGLLMFGSYLVRENEEVNLETPDTEILNKKRKGQWFPGIRKHGLFRFI